MSHAVRNLRLVFAGLASLCALAPSSASARFGLGFGFGGYPGAMMAPAPAPAPAYVANPGNGGVAHSGRTHHASKNKDADRPIAREAKVQRHRGWHDTTVADRTPDAPVPSSSVPARVPVTTVTSGAGPGFADFSKCLTKEYRADRSIVFKDNCTQESASTPPATPIVAPTYAPASTSSIRLEPLRIQDDLPQQMDGP